MMKGLHFEPRWKPSIAITLGLWLALAGCGGPNVSTDGGADSGHVSTDGGTRDSGTTTDAGGGTDGGGIDGGNADGGGSADGGGADGGDTDGGTGADSGLCSAERTWFECTDGVDNDCDGETDTDPDCSLCPPAAAPEAGAENDATQCGDGIDNDCNGYVDCGDFACRGLAGCSNNEDSDSLCEDGIDNDGNGIIDCLQRSCASQTPCQAATATATEDDATLCSNGLDDDHNGRADCDDAACDGIGYCAAENTEALCMDGHDNDGDGYIDCRDLGCRDFAYCGGEDSEATCTDGLDNDHDGYPDCRDLDCLALGVCHDHETACDDGTDDDLDGNADCHDSDCASACASTACSDANWFGSCTSPLACAEGVCARPLSTYTFPGDQPLLITEIMPNPKTIADNRGEYVEITNVSSELVNVQGIGIVNGTPGNEITFSGVRVLMPDETLLFVRNANSGVNGGLENGIAVTFNLVNGGDQVAIRHAGSDIHRVTYPGTTNDLENTGADQIEGRSFNLDQAFIMGTTTTATWCLTPEEPGNQYETTGPNYGTPGAPNLNCM